MLSEVLNSVQARIAFLLFAVYTLWWLGLNFIGGPGSSVNDYFSDSYWIVSLTGGIIGFGVAKKWGGTASVMGRAISVFSLGLVALALGHIYYSASYYLFGTEVPYPSLGDLGFFGSIPLYIYATFLLAKASGVRLGFQSLKGKLQAILVPIIMLGLGYYLFLQGYEFDWSQPVTVLLDFGYPLGQAIYVSLAMLTYLLSRSVLGGIMKNKVLFILLALVVQFVADYAYLFAVSRETWYAGSLNDYIYLLAYFLMTLGLIQLHPDNLKLGQAADTAAAQA